MRFGDLIREQFGEVGVGKVPEESSSKNQLAQ